MNDSDLYQFASKFFSAWRLLDTHDPLELPVNGGSMDRALEAVVENGTNVPDLAKKLLFVNTIAGRKCADLNQMVSTMNSAGLSHGISPTFTYFNVQIGPRVARRILQRGDDGEQFEEFTLQVMYSFYRNRSNLPNRW